MIADTKAAVQLIGNPGESGFIQVKMLAKGDQAQQLLSGGLQPTTGYSGEGNQRFSNAAQTGQITLSGSQGVIASGNLVNGVWTAQVNQVPAFPESLKVSFAGDPVTSYNINFKPSQGLATPVVRGFASRGEQAYLMQQAALSASPTLDLLGVSPLASFLPSVLGGW